MTLKMIKLTALSIGLMTHATFALEPKEDRAQIQNLYATLLLPDGSYLNADINFDCGSKFKDTGIIITTDSGANFLAKAYRSLYGDKAAEAVLNAWNTKANPNDPRKPTMLLINNFGTDSTYSTSNKNINKKLSVNSGYVNISDLERTKEIESAPPIMKLCGARVHENF
ncbi:hypothetical protein HG263_06800 [Pseudoalteromonas sp. JBTF-M23]|uniref:Uncharacterized protein n=1 Tax=Pseudoalteromonas caenipelagi TaxID=2726988 RepID=A0A849VEW9_9GAMM|nr:hypothetical protein [Pseudoalteromonas caenipelagi]NOU50251.1 hypothetical protein [Pseudoalteromonas caenipelagi]